MSKAYIPLGVFFVGMGGDNAIYSALEIFQIFVSPIEM